MSRPEEPNPPARAIFNGARQYDRFWRVKDTAPTRMMPASKVPQPWPAGESIALPQDYGFEGESRSIESLFTETDTVALLVLHEGQVRYERYALTGGPEVQWISMSVAKSFISTLVGIAISERYIGSINDRISDYVAVDPGSAYDGVTIKQALQMSSGARWNEDYSDSTSDIARLGAASAPPDGSLDDFLAHMVREAEADTICRYNSAETQVLATLVARATGKTVAEYMSETLYEPLGMVSPGYWMIDPQGREQCYAGLNLTARDYAKIGELFRNQGVWNGKALVPAEWVRSATMVDSPIREAGKPIVGGHAFDLGYGYQWWIPTGDRGEFAAIGVYNQYVYVDPTSKVTIVKLSANPRYGLSERDDDNRDIETIYWLRAIARSVH